MRYDGNWHADRREKEGKLTWPNGDVVPTSNSLWSNELGSDSKVFAVSAPEEGCEDGSEEMLGFSVSTRAPDSENVEMGSLKSAILKVDSPVTSFPSSACKAGILSVTVQSFIVSFGAASSRRSVLT